MGVKLEAAKRWLAERWVNHPKYVPLLPRHASTLYMLRRFV